MKSKLLLDIDGVLANFYVGFASYLNENYGCTLSLKADPVEYSFTEWRNGVEKIDVKQVASKWMENGGFMNVPVYQNAKNFFDLLSNMFDVYIVTARIGDWNDVLADSLQDKIRSDTLNWLKQNKIYSNKVFFVHEKSKFCLTHNIPVMVEDKHSTVVEASKNGLYSILIDRAYNGNKIDKFQIYRAYGYADAISQLGKLYG